MAKLTAPPKPCGSCPYRRDVPSGIWSAEEYDKLLKYDGPTWQQDTATFLCHQRDGNICGGWLACYGADQLLAMRLEYLKGNVTSEVMAYETTVPVFSSGAEAREHGIREIANPGVRAQNMVMGLLRKIRKRSHALQIDKNSR